MHGVMRALIARWAALIATLGLLALVIATSRIPCVPWAVACLTNALQVRTSFAGEQLGRRATTRDVERRTLEPGGFPMIKCSARMFARLSARRGMRASGEAQLNPELRRDFLDLELHWLKLARSYEVSERLKTSSRSRS